MKTLIVFVLLMALGAFACLAGVDLPIATDLTAFAGQHDLATALGGAAAGGLPGLMPFGIGTTYKACAGVIKAEQAAMPGTFLTVGEVTGWSLEENANIKSYFKLGDCNEQSGVTGISRSISIEGNYDPTNTGQDEFVPKIGDTVKIELYPIGTTSGLEKLTLTGVIETISRSGSGDDFVTFSASIKINTFVAGTVP